MSSTATSRATARWKFARRRPSSRSPSGCARGFAPVIPMTNSIALPSSSALWRHPTIKRQLPVLTMVLALLAIWYVGAVLMNMKLVRDGFEREETKYTTGELIAGTLSAERPLLAAPHQIIATFADGVFGYAPSSPRSLIYHSGVTLAATFLGFVIG